MWNIFCVLNDKKPNAPRFSGVGGVGVPNDKCIRQTDRKTNKRIDVLTDKMNEYY